MVERADRAPTRRRAEVPEDGEAKAAKAAAAAAGRAASGTESTLLDRRRLRAG